MKHRRQHSGSGLIALLGLVIWQASGACTLWGAAGTASHEGTLLAKNRDWRPDHVQSLQLRHPETGHAYVGLFADTGKAPGIKAGVNEKGLVVVSASASSLSRASREADPARHGVMREILRNQASLDEVEKQANRIFSRAKPVFLLLADASGLMQVEVGQAGKFRLVRQDNGTLSHTNHYANPDLLNQPQTIGDSSQARLERVRSLLARQPVHDLASFTAISQDRANGPDHGLWRSGARQSTLAGWQIALPKNAPPRLRLELANPGQPARTRDYVLTPAFWSQPEQRLLPDLTPTPAPGGH